MLLNKQLREGKWANWLKKIQEYDIEIKPLKVIKGQGLCKLIENSDSLDGMISISVEPLADSEWYEDIIFYLRSGAISYHHEPQGAKNIEDEGNSICVAWQRSGAIGTSSIGEQVSAVRSERRNPTTLDRTCKV
jgi:hypothetical protein